VLQTIGEFTGYLASAFLALSLLVNNDLKFRWLNTGGTISFIIYGVIIHAFPVILTNVILLLINAYRLYRIYQTEEDFDLLEFEQDDKIVHKFMVFHHIDMDAYFPSFELHLKPNTLRFVVLRDMVIANLFVADIDVQGNAEVKINYTVPKYRDYKVGRFIFEKERRYLISKGVRNILYRKVAHKQHADFLKVMGFEQFEQEGHSMYRKPLSVA
jgi:hypothetical protein